MSQLLQFLGGDLITRKDDVDEYSRIVAPVDTDAIIDSLHERIARVLHSEAIDAV